MLIVEILEETREKQSKTKPETGYRLSLARSKHFRPGRILQASSELRAGATQLGNSILEPNPFQFVWVQLGDLIIGQKVIESLRSDFALGFFADLVVPEVVERNEIPLDLS